MAGLYSEVGKIFDPALFYMVEAGFTQGPKLDEAEGREELISNAEYVNYSMEELIDQVARKVAKADVGDEIEVDMGIAILSARVVIDREVYDAGDGYLNPPYYERTVRLEDVEIVEENGTRRIGEEETIKKLIF